MRFKQSIILLIVFVSFSVGKVFSQEAKRSTIVEEIGGRAFYIHLLQPGETITDLEALYEVTSDEIFKASPGIYSEADLKPNLILRIPKSTGKKELTSLDTIVEAPRAKPSFSVRSEKEMPAVKHENISVGKEKVSAIATTEKKVVFHQIKAKETLYSLSKKYQVTTEQIKQANPGLGDALSINRTIRIPVYLAKEEKPEIEDDSFSFYTVRPKETVFRIAKNFGISQEELLNWNPQIQSEGLKAGGKIKIPHKSSTTSMANSVSSSRNTGVQSTANRTMKVSVPDTIQTIRHYKVKFLEKLSGIAKRENITVQEIYRLNPGLQEKGIGWGDIIKLPGTAIVKTGGASASKENQTSYIIHKVQKHETLYSISKLYDVLQEDIIALNPGTNHVINKDQRLKIPVKKQVTVEEPEQVVEEIHEPVKKEENAICHDLSGMNQTFRIALMIPFYLDEYTAIDTAVKLEKKPNPKSFNFLQFYEGALVALDTLKKQGVNAEVVVYDIGKDERDAVYAKDARLRSVDLIIGPIYNAPFQVIKAFAEENGIPLVNPLSSREEIIRATKEVFKIQTSVDAEISAMAKYIAENYRENTSIFLVRNNAYQNQEQMDLLKKELSANGVYHGMDNSVKEVLYYSDSLNPVLDSANWAQQNIVVGLSDREVFTIEFVRHLNEMHDSIPNLTLYGLSEWKKYSLEKKHLYNLNTHVFDGNYIDYDREEVKWFVKQFRAFYATEPEPSKYAYDGFDIMYYFLSALNTFGTDFENCLQHHHPLYLQRKMVFEENSSGSYENISVSPQRYYQYDLYKLD